MFRPSLCFAFAAALIGSIGASAPSANAALLVRSADFSPPGTAAPQVAFQAFDPSLGTLNSVELVLSGTITATFPTPALADPQGAPVPYDFSATVTQSFVGLGGLSGFGFGAPAQFQLSGLVASGEAGGVVSVPLIFSYTMRFTELSNVTGFGSLASFSGPTVPPPRVGGTLQMFIAGPDTATPLIIGQTATPPIGLGEIGRIIGSSVMSGAASLTFDYSAAAPPPQPIPEPPMLWLVGLAAVAAVAAKRRRPGCS